MSAASYIGCAISLLSHSDVRYRGILEDLDRGKATIKLRNVYSMGTERRRPAEEYIPPAELPYEYIIFRAAEVKDLALDNEPPVQFRSVHDDPAVIGAKPAAESEDQYNLQDQYQSKGGVPANLGARPPQQRIPSVSPGVTSVVASAATVSLKTSVPSTNGVSAVPEQSQAKRAAGLASTVNRMANASVNSVHSATQSLENVERALGDLKLANAQAAAGGTRGGRRSGGARDRHNNSTPITIPTTEYDFESANARFKKANVRKNSVNKTADGDDSDSRTNPSDDDEETTSKTSSKDDKAAAAYNPKTSFFDSLSSSSLPGEGGRGGRGRGGRRGGNGGGRSRREEERQKNVATFGEAGGRGLMGPEAYVGGYGGYGRGRRGGGPGRGGRGRGPRREIPISAGFDQ